MGPEDYVEQVEGLARAKLASDYSMEDETRRHWLAIYKQVPFNRFLHHTRCLPLLSLKKLTQMYTELVLGMDTRRCLWVLARSPKMPESKASFFKNQLDVEDLKELW